MTAKALYYFILPIEILHSDFYGFADNHYPKTWYHLLSNLKVKKHSYLFMPNYDGHRITRVYKSQNMPGILIVD